MALSATFAADFSAFTTACAQAEVSLKGIESGAGSVESTLNRMANSLSGTKIIQQATLMAEAVERVGGVSTLTVNELARLGPVADEAANKMRAMGVDVPDRIQAIADAAKQAHQETSGWTQALDLAKDALKVFGVSLGLEAIKGFAEHVIAAGAAIGQTAEKLDLSAETVQRWQYALQQSGGSMAAFSTSVLFLNKTLGKNEAGTAAMLEALGLSLENLRLQDTEARVRSVTSAIAAQKDPILQTQAAYALLGRGVEENLTAIKAGLDETGKAATVLTDTTVRRLHDAEQAWKNFGNAVVTYSGEALGALAGLVEKTDAIALRESVQRAAAAEATRKGITTTEELTIAWAHGAEGLQAYLDGLQHARDALAGTIGPTQQQASALEVLHGTLAKLNQEYDALSPAVRQQIADDKAHGASVQELATAYDTSASTIQRAIDAQTAQTSAQKAAAAELEQYTTDLAVHDEIQGRMNALVSTSTGTVGEYAQALITAGASLSDVKAVTGLASGQLEQFKKAIDAAAAETKAAAEQEKQFARDTETAYTTARRLTEDYTSAAMRASGNLLHAKLADNTRWFDDEFEKLLRSKADYSSYYAALDALRLRKAQKDQDALREQQAQETQARNANILLWDTYFVDLAKLHKKDVMDAELRQVQDGLQAQLDAVDRLKPRWEETYDAQVAIAAVRQAQIAQNYHDKAIQPMIDDGVKLFDAALKGWDAFKSALEGIWAEILHAFEEKLVAEMVNAWLGGLAKMAAAWESSTLASIGSWLASLFGFGGKGEGQGDFGDLPPGATIGPGTGHPTPKPAATGGLVTESGIDWSPQGTDTVPAILTPGERVLSVTEARSYRGGGGGTVLVMLDGRLLAQAVVPEFEGAVRRLGFGG